MAPARPPTPDSGPVTRFIESPALVPHDLPEAGSERSLPGNDQPAFGDGSTVILEPGLQSIPTVRLVGTAGPAQGLVFEVGVAGATVGRVPESSICLTDGRLSRQHARIEFKDGGYWLSDLASQNGTLVNGRPLSEACRLRAGDSIELGTSRLTVMLDPESSS
jgi:pSer/pThr/pTyr-binding forkhead associated (FHA) protein